MTWESWVIRLAAEVEPPREWDDILEELRKILESKYIEKVELAAFVIRGSRLARWKIAKGPEYASMEDSLGAAKKLTALLLLSKGAPQINPHLRMLLRCSKRTDCNSYEGHSAECNPNLTIGAATCGLCKEIINIDDFQKDGRKDPTSIQMGHFIPLSRGEELHNSSNVNWQHRRCNYIQGEQTVEEAMTWLQKILVAHNFDVSKAENSRF